MVINSGFFGRRENSAHIPPGQYVTRDFPVLSLGVTPRVNRDTWQLELFGLAKELKWDWYAFDQLPKTQMTTDIHCVTRWSKLGTHWEGVLLDEIMKQADVRDDATHVIAHCHDGYTTNLPITDVINGQAMVATAYEDEEIPAEHGGPVRLFVPHLYFWKSAKWLKALEFTDHDEPGFWETRGYHNYGDPWKEQRYTDD